MTERIDHAAEAREALADTREFIENIEEPSAYALRVAANGFAEAQAHATLALVEQQRIANLIAIWAVPNDAETHLVKAGGVTKDAGDRSAVEITEALGLS